GRRFEMVGAFVRCRSQEEQDGPRRASPASGILLDLSPGAVKLRRVLVVQLVFQVDRNAVIHHKIDTSVPAIALNPAFGGDVMILLAKKPCDVVPAPMFITELLPTRVPLLQALEQIDELSPESCTNTGVAARITTNQEWMEVCQRLRDRK